ncbi:MAG: sulfotransferase, partial [Phycisphaerales bacterium]|nr:sulfotransferase [Phycisphaerales bacterium]
MQNAPPNVTRNGTSGKPALLVTGAPRSGTTWAGKVFASVANTLYAHEPFNPNSPCAYSPLRVPCFFYRLAEDKNARELKYMQDLINIKYRRCSIRLCDLKFPKTALSRMKYCSQGLLGMVKADRAVIKDPIAIMSADILCRHLNIKPLFMVREPAACVSSIYIRNWRTDFRLLNPYTDRLEEIIPGEIDQLKKLAENPDHDLIENAAFVWRISNLAIIRYLEQNPDWIITRHEDLVEDPISAFRNLFDEFDFV